jgi:hypothetical protein
MTKATMEIPRSQRKMDAIWSNRLSFPFDRIPISLNRARNPQSLTPLLGAIPGALLLRQPRPTTTQMGPLKPLSLRHRADF